MKVKSAKDLDRLTGKAEEQKPEPPPLGDLVAVIRASDEKRAAESREMLAAMQQAMQQPYTEKTVIVQEQGRAVRWNFRFIRNPNTQLLDEIVAEATYDKPTLQ
jgi:hypothetical protein